MGGEDKKDNYDRPEVFLDLRLTAALFSTMLGLQPTQEEIMNTLDVVAPEAYETEAEREEREAAQALAAEFDRDMGVWLEATYVDPAEMYEPHTSCVYMETPDGYGCYYCLYT